MLDIRGFFDAMAHSWIIRFLEHRIADKRILRLIAKWLKVGIVDDGRRTRGVCGAPQGAVISPILANVYLHYVVGRNLRIDIRWGSGDNERYRKYAAELNALAPDVVLGTNSPIVGIVQQTNRALPIVFVQLSDPVGSGIVASLARPGGNVTGFANGEFGTTAKWLELLKQIAPAVMRVAVLRDSTNPAEIAQFAALQSVAP
jgi:hypothetical protein